MTLAGGPHDRYVRLSYDAVTGKTSGSFANTVLAELLELRPREMEERYDFISKCRGWITDTLNRYEARFSPEPKQLHGSLLIASPTKPELLNW